MTDKLTVHRVNTSQDSVRDRVKTWWTEQIETIKAEINDLLADWVVQRDAIILKLSTGELSLKNLPEKLCNDPEMVFAAIWHNITNLQYLGKELHQDREFILRVVRTHAHTLRFASEIFRADREIVLAAIEVHGSAYKYIPDALQNDREFSILALNTNILVFKSLPEVLQNDREIVLYTVQLSGRMLEYVPHALEHDREIVLAAVRSEWLAIRHAFIFRNDEWVVFAAFSQDRASLWYASKELREKFKKKYAE